MATLQEQIRPQMTMVPAEDQTFRQYVEELLRTSKGFSGPFATPQQKQQQPTPTTNISEGLFSKYLQDTSGSGGDNAISSNNGISAGGGFPGLNTEGLANALSTMAPQQAMGVISGLLSGNIGSALTAATGHDFLGNVAQYAVGKLSNAINGYQDPTNVPVTDLSTYSGWSPAGVSPYGAVSTPVNSYGPVVGTPLGMLSDSYGSGGGGGGVGGATDNGQGTGGGFGVGSVGASGEGEASDGLGP